MHGGFNQTMNRKYMFYTRYTRQEFDHARFADRARALGLLADITADGIQVTWSSDDISDTRSTDIIKHLRQHHANGD